MELHWCGLFKFVLTTTEILFSTWDQLLGTKTMDTKNVLLPRNIISILLSVGVTIEE